MHTTRVVDRYTLWQVGQQPIHSGIERQDGLQPGQGVDERWQLGCVLHSQDSEFHIRFRGVDNLDPFGQRLEDVVVGILWNDYF